MDTVEILFDDPSISAGLRKRILSLDLPYTNSRYKPDEWRRGRQKRVRLGFNEQYQFELEGKKLLVALRQEPCSIFVGCHFGQFDTFSSAFEWLKSIWGPETKYFFKGLVKRVDLCVDIGIPYETIAASMFQPRVLHCQTMGYADQNGKKTWGSIYLGRYPRMSYAYRKPLFAHKFDFNPPSTIPDSRGMVDGTRFEVRHHGKYLPFRSLAEIGEVAQLENPFGHLRFLKLELASTVGAPVGTKFHQVQGFIRRAEKLGFHLARRECNNHSRNFQRDIGRYLLPFDGLDLEAIWKSKLARYFDIKPGLVVHE